MDPEIVAAFEVVGILIAKGRGQRVGLAIDRKRHFIQTLVEKDIQPKAKRHSHCNQSSWSGLRALFDCAFDCVKDCLFLLFVSLFIPARPFCYAADDASYHANYFAASKNYSPSKMHPFVYTKYMGYNHTTVVRAKQNKQGPFRKALEVSDFLILSRRHSELAAVTSDSVISCSSVYFRTLLLYADNNLPADDNDDESTSVVPSSYDL
jgi:hypothetical protein